MFSSLIIVVYFWLNVLYIYRLKLLGILEEMMLLGFDLLKGLKAVIRFLVMTKMYPMRFYRVVHQVRFPLSESMCHPLRETLC